VAWIQVTTGTSGSANGTVTLSIAPNTGASRTGAITIGGQTVTVTQAVGTVPCSYGVAPTNQTVGAGAGPGTAVAVTAGTGCAWTAVSGVSWITVTSGAAGSGNGTVNFSVDANTGASRTGTITIAGQTFTVTQNAGVVSCTYGIAPTNQTVGAGAGPGAAVTVTAGAGCAWTAVSNATWITLGSGTPGTGNGTVNFTVAANTGAARTGTITIAGQTVTVNQAAFVCTYMVAPTSASFPSAGGSSMPVSVTAPTSCTWTATSNTPVWITVTSGATGSGNGNVVFSVAVNSTGLARTGTLTIATQTFTVSQSPN
jgi:hypothetical protein